MMTSAPEPKESPVDIDVSAAAQKLQNEHIVVDFLALYYVLEEKYAERVLNAGVSAVNLTFGGDESWEPFLRSVETGLGKIEKSPVLSLALNAEDIRTAKRDG